LQVPAVQFGVQQALPASPLPKQVSPWSQPPVQIPPQLSLSPHTLPAQFGVQHWFW
jgi:hypothetical protein